MPPFALVDLVCGGGGIACALGLRRYARRHPLADPDAHVVRDDLGLAMLMWGATVLVLGLLATGGFPGGFTMPIWSVLALGLGALGAGTVALRSWVDHWEIAGPPPEASRFRVRSETWGFGLVGAAAAGGLTFLLAASLNVMQPVHAAISVLEAVAGYAVGLVVWTPRVRIERLRSASFPDADDGRAGHPGSRRGRAGQD